MHFYTNVRSDRIANRKTQIKGVVVSSFTLKIATFFTAETIAFNAVLISFDTIPDESAVLFHEVLLNEGDG